MVVTLIGYRGTGKSTVARRLAGRLGWTAVDADDEIQRRAGMSIADLFAAEGEPGFRRRERDVMRELLVRERVVIAAGGGAVLDPDTRQEMRAAGPVVWLTADVDTILERLAADESTAQRRPNLTVSGGRAEIEQLLAEREPLYRQTADAIVDTPGKSPDDLVAEVLRQVKVEA